MKLTSWIRTGGAALALAAGLLAGPGQAAPVNYHVTVDTSSVAGGTLGYIDMQFNAGGPNAQAAQAAVSNFMTDGTLGAEFLRTGTVVGSLPGTVTFDNNFATAPNELAYNFTFGTPGQVKFDLALSGPAIDSPNPAVNMGEGSTFALAFFDTSFNPLFTDGSLPGGQSVLQFNVNADGTVTPVLSPNVGGGPSVVEVTPFEPPPQPGAGVPEPASLALLLAGGLGLWAVRRRGRK